MKENGIFSDFYASLAKRDERDPHYVSTLTRSQTCHETALKCSVFYVLSKYFFVKCDFNPLLWTFILYSIMSDPNSSTSSSEESVQLYDNFLQMSLGELQDYLSLRNLNISGRKRELVARAFAACEQNVPVAISDMELNKKLKAEYQTGMVNLDIDPMCIEKDMWKDDVTSWPPLDLGKIFAFILSKKQFDSDYVGKYKLCKAYSYFASGFVGTIFSYGSDEYTILACKVTPSQRIRDEAHDVWVAIKKWNML